MKIALSKPAHFNLQRHLDKENDCKIKRGEKQKGFQGHQNNDLVLKQRRIFIIRFLTFNQLIVNELIFSPSSFVLFVIFFSLFFPFSCSF